MSPAHVVIAIDGPAASGKSSVARALARRIGFVYVNTGAMYRAFTWQVLREGVASADAEAVRRVLANCQGEGRMECGVEGGESTIRMGGVDPSEHLASEEVNGNVSNVAAVPEVRRFLVDLQRCYAREWDVVMEGRDIGSVVFPETVHKFYIDASPEIRAQRRARQGLRDAIGARDRQDSSRAESPLLVAEGAQVVDSSLMSVEEVVGELVARLRAQGLDLK